MLADDAGEISAKLSFSRDEDRHYLVRVEVDAEVMVTCQRCLEPMPSQLHSDNTLAAVWSDEEARHLPKRLDPLIAGEEGYPLWDLVIGEVPPGEDFLDRAEAEDLRFVVIDKRQADDVPMIGFYLDQREPLATEREEPVSSRSLEKWDDMDYALRIYESNEMIIYRLDSSAYDTSFRQVGNIGSAIGEEQT